MTPEEAQAFEQDPLCQVSLRLRHWDEQAKEMHVPVLDLEVLKAKARQVLTA
jgi:predicted HD phosphohydrolase